MIFCWVKFTQRIISLDPDNDAQIQITFVCIFVGKSDFRFPHVSNRFVDEDWKAESDPQSWRCVDEEAKSYYRRHGGLNYDRKIVARCYLM